MPYRTTIPLLGLLWLILLPGWAGAQPPMRPPAVPRLFLAPLPVQEPGLQCRQAIRSAERAAGLPDQLMAAIGHVESGRSDAQGVIHPWPWTINAEGEGHMYESKAEAIAAVKALQAQGVQSIDVGCMQVNLMFHPNAFGSLDQAFDPVANANYAARFLTELYQQTHSWTEATAHYHSATPELGAEYQRKVAAVLPVELRQARDAGGGNVWTQNVWNTGPGAQPVTPGAAASKNSVFAQGGGGFMLSNGADNVRLLAAPSNVVGRSLGDYRARPIPVASRVVPRAPL